jgi:hypothetical protein
MESRTVNMKDFIRAPYWTCPRCGVEKFGVLLINRDSYKRCCSECTHKADFPLPKLKKKIIYLDQFVISEIMKLNNPGTKAHAAVADNPFWSELDKLLKELRHLQLICCPASGEHENESLLSRSFAFADFKKTYENLSGGVYFDSGNTIKTKQVVALVQAWARGIQHEFSFEASRIINGKPHGWSERCFPTTDSSYMEQHADTLREDRKKLHNGLSDVFNNTWKVKRLPFSEWYDLQINSYQTYMLRNAKSRNEKRMELAITPWLLSIEDILNSEYEYMVQIISEIIDREAQSNKTIKTGELCKSFFTECRLADAPFNKIRSAMYAAIAIRAAGGQKNPPDQGMITDIELVSTLLPYCDAMFMDNRCRATLQHIPKSHRPEGVEKVYSMNRKDEFLNYLRSIRAEASVDHLELVKQVYGGR